MQISTIGIDLAKTVFQVHGVDAADKPVLKKQLRREQSIALPTWLVGICARRVTGLDVVTSTALPTSVKRVRGSARAGRRNTEGCEGRGDSDAGSAERANYAQTRIISHGTRILRPRSSGSVAEATGASTRSVLRANCWLDEIRGTPWK